MKTMLTILSIFTFSMANAANGEKANECINLLRKTVAAAQSFTFNKTMRYAIEDYSASREQKIWDAAANYLKMSEQTEICIRALEAGK